MDCKEKHVVNLEPPADELSTRIAAFLVEALGHQRAGRPAEAENAYRNLLDIEPMNAETWHLSGLIALQLGDHAAAVDLIGKATAQAPHHADYWNDLAAAQEGLGMLAEAEASLRRSLALDTDDLDALVRLGRLLGRQGRAREAEDTYNHALEIRPQYLDALVNLGILYTELGQIPQAMQTLRRATQASSQLVAAHRSLGHALRMAGYPYEAEQSFLRAMEIAADLPHGRPGPAEKGEHSKQRPRTAHADQDPR